jgi:predicted component of type VI protein secretion system
MCLKSEITLQISTKSNMNNSENRQAVASLVQALEV